MSSVSTEAPQPPRLLEGVAKPTAEPKKRKHADTEPEQLKNNSMGGSSYVLNAPSLSTVVQRQEPPSLISAEMQLVFSQITDVPTGDSIPVSARNMIGTATYPPGGSDTVEAPLTNDVQPSAPSNKEPAITKATKVLFTKEQDVLILNAAATANAAGSKMNWFQISQSLNRSAYFCEQRLQQLMDSNYIDTSTSTADVPVAIINSSFGKKGKMPFTEQEDNLLRDAVSNANKEEGGRVHWEKTSRSLGRSVYYCKQRWQVLSVGNDKNNKQDGCTGTSHKKSSMTAASSSLAPSANAASATIKNTSVTTSASTSSSNAPLISAPSASAAKFKVPAKSADSKQNKPPPPREFSKDEIVLILQAGHEAGGVSRRTRWVKLSKQLHCTVRDCEHQWELLQAARRRATKAMVLLGVPTGLETINNSSTSIININVNSSSSGSSSGATTSKVAYGVTSGDNSISSSEGISAVADPTVTMHSESSDLADVATADTVVATNSVPAKRKYTKKAQLVPGGDSALDTTTTPASKKRIGTKPVTTVITIEDSATAHVVTEKPSTGLESEVINSISDTSTAAPSLVPAKIDTTKADHVSATTAHQLPQTRHPRRFTKEEDEQIREAVETAQSERKILVWADVGRLLKRRGEVIQQRWLKSLAPGAGTITSSGLSAAGIVNNGVNIAKGVAVSGGEEENGDCVEVDKATVESKFTHQRQAPQLFTEYDDLIITQYMETAYTERRRVRWPEVAAKLNRTTHACKQRWHARLLIWYGAMKGPEYEAMSPALRAIVTEKPGPNAFSSVQDFTILHSYDAYIAKQGSTSVDVTCTFHDRSRTNNGTYISTSSSSSSSNSSSSIIPTICNIPNSLQPLWDALSHQLHKSTVHISDRCAKLLEERDGTDKLTTLWTIYNQMCSAKLLSTGGTDEASIVVDSLARAVRQKVHDGGVRNSNIDTKRDLAATNSQKSNKATKLPKVTTASTVIATSTVATSSSTETADISTMESRAKTSDVAVKKKRSLKDTVVSRNIYDSIAGDANDSDSSDSGIADNAKNTIPTSVQKEIANKTTHEVTPDSDSSDSCDSSDSSNEESSTIVAAAGSTSPAPKRRKGGNHSPGRKHGCNKTARVNKTFTTEEDVLIVQAALAAKEGKIVNWPALGKLLGRMGCICRRRWVRHLSKRDEAAIAELQNMIVPLPAPSVAESDPINQLNRGRAPRRTFTDTDDAHILEAVRAAVNEGKSVVWREVGEKLNRTGQSCSQRWTLTLAPRHPELKEILSSFL